MNGEKIIADLSKTLRKFFADMLDIKYQFTYDELREELKKCRLDDRYRIKIEEFFKRLVEMQYSGREITEEEARDALKEAELMIKKLSGCREEYVIEEKPKPAVDRKSFLDRAVGRIKKATGVSIKFKKKPPLIAKDVHNKPAVQPAVKAPSKEHQPPVTVSGINNNLDSFAGEHVRLRGSISFVNRIMETNDFWYMFSDSTDKIVAVTKSTDRYGGEGVLRGKVKKTLTGEGFIEIERFE